MSKILGIDLGTTNSAMAIMEGGTPTVIPNSEGARITPSMVAVLPDGSRAVGISAKNQMVLNPNQTFYSIKRLIGRKWDDPEVQRDVKLFPFKLRKGSSGGVEILVGSEWFPPEGVSAMILGKLKADAEKYIGEKITDAVITVPAYFDDSQRQATKNAGKIAGLDVKRIINEPTAAALAYGVDKKEEETVVVYDLGGGTFDISVLELGDGVFEVIATNGDTHLGGDDFDQRIINYIADEFKKSNAIDLREDTAALQRLKEAAEKAKIELSSVAQTTINLPFITADASGPKHLNMSLTRAQLENIVRDLIDKTIEPIKKALSDSKKKVEDIHEVILVGGMTRMPLVVETVTKFFGKDPNQSVNPDEVVAIGAAVQAGVLSGDVKDVTLLDVTPLSLGIETLGGVSTKLIERNSTIPIEKKQIFSTAADNQTAVEIHIVQGEREMAGDNKTLGRFTLDGIPPAPRGVPQVEVTFDIDANGILNVKAQDKATNKEQKVTITATTGLSKEEIDQMVKDAAEHATDDSNRKELVEVKNHADSTVFTAEKLVKDNGEKINENDKKEIETLSTELKKLIENENFSKDDVTAKTSQLSDLLQKIGAAMYQKDPNSGDSTGTPNSGESNPDQAQEGEIVS